MESEELDLGIFDSIISEMREIYLSDTAEWLIMTSHGKDSTLQLTCVWKMLETLPIELRTKRVHVITGNTLVETPMMQEYVLKNLQAIEKAAIAQGLPIEVHMVVPEIKERFYFQVLGKGNPPPTERSSYRWCTDKMKLRPTERLTKSILNDQSVEIGRAHDLLMLLGVRIGEGTARGTSISKHQVSKEGKMAKHSSNSRILVYHPIKFITKDELWEYLMKLKKLPWGVRTSELYLLYKDSTGECPLTAEGNPSKSCGGGRMGCTTCLVTGRQDKMLSHLIESGEESMEHLLEWKLTLYDVRLDVRYREPLRKVEFRRHQKNQEHNEKLSLFDSLEDSDYLSFSRAKDWEFKPGPITIEGRKMLLKKLLSRR